MGTAKEETIPPARGAAMNRKYEPELRSIPRTRWECSRRGELTHSCRVRFDCKTGHELRTWQRFCDALCEQGKCPRGFPWPACTSLPGLHGHREEGLIWRNLYGRIKNTTNGRTRNFSRDGGLFHNRISDDWLRRTRFYPLDYWSDCMKAQGEEQRELKVFFARMLLVFIAILLIVTWAVIRWNSTLWSLTEKSGRRSNENTLPY